MALIRPSINPSESAPLQVITPTAMATPPLCVDLDGTLVRTDTFQESLLRALRSQPREALNLIRLWWKGGRAAVKKRVAALAPVDVGTLPYEDRLIEFLIAEKQTGRTLVLVTGADRQTADAVAAHLGLFDSVLASDGVHNLSGRGKREMLDAEYGFRAFDYIGNAAADIPVWKSARRAYAVNASAVAVAYLRRMGTPSERFLVRAWPAWRAAWKAMRPHQWAKNVLIFVPLLTSHRLRDLSALTPALMAFTAFSLCASACYLVNDLLDIGADRRHPTKRERPFASGRLSLPAGAAATALALATAATIAWFLPPAFGLTLAIYLLGTLSYTFWWKKVPLVDVTVLALLYGLRIFAGGVASEIRISPWLFELSSLIFFSLAMAKRCSELRRLRAQGDVKPARRGYLASDVEPLSMLGMASGYGAAVVLAIYVHSPESLLLYRHPQWLWLICPQLMYWISRVWLLEHRGALHEDPVVFAIKDGPSYVIAALVIAVLAFSA
jgi:4-hydroxybenzoate polyprenyltransferase